MSDLQRIHQRVRLHRKVKGIAAALLPMTPQGRPAEEDFVRHLRATHAAGLLNAVNMDTGYANYLSDDEKTRVLRLTRDALGPGVPFVAGAYVEGREGDLVGLYRREIARILEFGGTPILFQTSRLHGRSPREKVEVYRQAVAEAPEALAFELGTMFAPNGEIFDEETVRGLMEIPTITGMKHSSLSKRLELRRLELRDRVRPDFALYTGNDLGIDMIEYGSDYLLGLATFCPEKFAERDRLWEQGDAGYLELSDALQDLGNLAFRPPVPAYKHSAAVFLHLLGRISHPHAHPRCPTRPEWERELLLPAAQRLGLAV